MLKAGATEVCITPPIGVELAGYGPRLRRYSTDVHDHLMAQALVLDDGQNQVALITSDLIGISPEVTQLVRREVHKRTDIPPECVMVSCAHIHTAPTAGPTRDWGSPDRSYIRMVARHMTGAVVASAGKLQPVQLKAGRGEHPDLAWNRIGREEVDPTIEVVRVDTPSGDPVALLVHYACHPVMLGPKRVISADYPGALRRYLQRQYPGGVVMFANGACGDIDPVSNREVWGQGTFDDVARAGAALGEDAWETARGATPVDDVRVQVRQGTLRLEYDVPSPETIRERIAYYRAEARAQGDRPESFAEVTGEPKLSRFLLRYYRALEKRILAGEQPEHENAELQAFVVEGALAMLAIPGEVFTAQGQAMRASSTHAHTLPICYANGSYGYFPPRAEFEQGGYAAGLAAAVHDRPPFRPGVAEKLVEAATKLL